MRVDLLGDIAFTGRYNLFYKNGVNPFSDVSTYLSKADIVVGNLECLSKGELGENHKKKPRLKTELETLNLLKKLNLECVTLAHNHIYDNLEDGFKKTINFLESKHISYIGASFDDSVVAEPFIYSKGEVKIAFLNYVTADTNPNLPDNCNISLNWFEEEKVKQDIIKYKNKVDHIVLLLHWGGDFEGAHYPNIEQSNIARRLVDFGADLIIGHHSHTLQPYEIYNGKYIFYSLGNFCFDDFVSDDRKFYAGWPKRRMQSAIVSALFEKSKITVEVYETESKNCHIFFSKGKLEKKNRIFLIMLKFDYLWKLYKFYFKKIEPYFLYIINPNYKLKEKIVTFWRKIS